ncbi:Alpha/Beta hydrolase protein [Mycena amicta]|nr:Alpha/Beta hydrolase protein [Mycena amicta]
MAPPAPYDYTGLEFTEPAEQIKAFNMNPVPQRIFDDMRKYEAAARGFGFTCFEKPRKGDDGQGSAIISHRPEDSQVEELYRISLDPQVESRDRITHFDFGGGRIIAAFHPIVGDDWRGIWRPGGAVFNMDLDGNEYFQLWRYWEDDDTPIPPIDGELQNSPGGRIEQITHDEHKYQNIVVSDSQKIMAFVSNKENGTDLLVYISELVNSKPATVANSQPFTLPSRLVTPLPEKGHSRWAIGSISIDDQYLLLIDVQTSALRPIFIVPTSGGHPEPILLPNATEKESETAFSLSSFSRDLDRPHLLYLLGDAFGAFQSIYTYDIKTRSVLHITTPEPSLQSIRPIPWDCSRLAVNSECVYFQANVDGYTSYFAWPLRGPLKDQIVQIKPQWEGGQFTVNSNAKNGKPYELVVTLRSHLSQSHLARLDLEGWFVPENLKTDEAGGAYISVPITPYKQATPIPPSYPTFPSKLIRFKSFDGLEIPCMYYHPTNGQTIVPLVLDIHGGPEGQSDSNRRMRIHWYITNELGCAVILPNVRGSRGYGKFFMAADSVEKREDSLKDIGALLDHVEQTMKNELDATRIAVMGGSYGGYMTLATLIHFPTRFACGLANFPIAHWPSFLEKTAPSRADHRRGKYGDERIPEIRAFLERISPLNRTSEITVPLQIAHGDSDSRVPVDQAIRMWQTVMKNGVHTELMVCAKEGHGFGQKSVIEFTNAAKLHFLERWLLNVQD